MSSLVVLMIEHEQPEGLSSRKLVVETIKHNVLTAYTPKEGLDLLRRFPAVDVILIHATVLDHLPLIPQVKQLAPGVPIVVASPNPAEIFEGADFIIPSHQPQALVDLLVREFHISRSSERN